MNDSLEIRPLAEPLSATAHPPGSKSITNRALVCAALAEGPSVLKGALDSEDTQVMVAALGQLGIRAEFDEARENIAVDGCGGRIPARSADLFVANSGTTVRFLTALVALGHGTYRLDGTPRMRERPIRDLLDALDQLGLSARSELETGCPPVVIKAAGFPGGQATVRGDVSSQFLSGLLMAAPYARGPLELSIAGPLVSQPYIRMTLRVMKSFGIDVDGGDLTRFAISAPAAYRGRQYAIEPDASAASYFWAAAAIAGGSVTVAGLSRGSLQGDVEFCECLAQMGCRVTFDEHKTTVSNGSSSGGRGKLRGIHVDMNAISDTVPTLSAVALFAQGPTRIRNVAHIRHKETDRIAALVTELRKFGAQVDEHADGLTITPRPLHGAGIDTYDDHRMAMSMALVGLAIPGVLIHDPGCTAKTYPHFFRDLSRLAS
jgi:3-phosphoshikimate 1-carboxyvinyltransferase